ncbi:hypothetical protein [Mesorhizobium sp.]|uniref:hypothetical protein n=1 Tax=Mesorhizobium sp. TaxID=1871066 RepID=UPI000FE480D0|nr:hypothetical protein [Mesorhizobium sp.]RWC30294.1 MAG: hypothetical protein EOS27_13650 [Mesorhizobium sp.]TIX26613.1 MAG: hypothetical protein E5V35_09935 [Mesorhizobium sp.]
MFSRSRVLTAARQAGRPEAPLTAACSCLMGIVLLAMLCFGQPVAPAFADTAPSGASVGVERSGEVAALLRVTSKAQALEVRVVRPALVKFTGGHPVLPAPEAVCLWVERTSPRASVSGYGAALVPRAGTNQPRAPPSIAA